MNKLEWEPYRKSMVHCMYVMENISNLCQVDPTYRSSKIDRYIRVHVPCGYIIHTLLLVILELPKYAYYGIKVD